MIKKITWLLILIMTTCFLCSSLALADVSHAHLTLARRHGHAARRHHAHKAGRHHAHRHGRQA